jgi:hypothetical protein
MRDIDDFDELPEQEGEIDPGGGGVPDDGGTDTPPDDERAPAERAIDAKRRALDRAGRGLGSPRTGVEDAGHGGRVQTFERGRIYWHPATGAHEVHGGILQAYLARGGPDRNPKTGRRNLKFPTSDEVRAADGQTPVSHFEAGAIYWVDGIGGVAIYGDIETQWRRMGGEQGWLGLPLSDPHERDGVDVAFFEHGCLWSGPGSGGQVLSYRFNARPLDGRQTMVDPDDPDTLVFPSPLVTTVADATVPDVGGANRLAARRVDGPTLPDAPDEPDDSRTPGPPIPPLDPDELDEIDSETERQVGASGRSIWADTLVLTPSDGGAASVPLSVSSGGATRVDREGTVMFRHDLRIDDASRLEPGTPYHVRLRLPDGTRYPLFTDAVLVESDASAERSDLVFVDDEIDVIGRVRLRRRGDNPETLFLDTEEGNIVLGGDERDGDIRMRDGSDTERVHLDTGAPKAVDREHVRVYVDGREGNLTLGSHGVDGRDGDLRMRDGDGIERVHLDTGAPKAVDREHVRIRLDGREGTLSLGADGVPGTVELHDGDGDERLVVDGDAGDVRLDLAGDGTTESLRARIHDLERRLADLEG